MSAIAQEPDLPGLRQAATSAQYWEYVRTHAKPIEVFT